MHFAYVFATIKRIITNICNSIRDYNACKITTFIECEFPNACNTIRYYNACKVKTVVKCPPLYACYC